MRYKYDYHFQSLVLKFIIEERKIKYLTDAPEDIFDNEFLTRIFRFLKKRYRESRRVAGYDEIASGVEGIFDAEDEFFPQKKDKALAVLEELKEGEIEDAEGLEQIMYDFFRMQKVRELTEEVLDDVDHGKYDLDKYRGKINDIQILGSRSEVDDKKEFEEKVEAFFKKREEISEDEPLGYRLNNFKQLEEHIDGVQPGLHSIPAKSHVGKTALMLNLTWDLLESNEDIKVIFISLDDSFESIIGRFISIKAEVDYAATRKKQDNKELEDKIQKVKEEIINLCKKGKLIIKYSYFSIGDLRGYINENNKEENVVLMIDGPQKLRINGNYKNTIEEDAVRAGEVKKISNDFDIPIIVSKEVIKNSRENLKRKEIAGSRKWIYDANTILLLQNQNMNGNNAKKVINYEIDKSDNGSAQIGHSLSLDTRTSKITEM